MSNKESKTQRKTHKAQRKAMKTGIRTELEWIANSDPSLVQSVLLQIRQVREGHKRASEAAEQQGYVELARRQEEASGIALSILSVIKNACEVYEDESLETETCILTVPLEDGSKRSTVIKSLWKPSEDYSLAAGPDDD